MARRRDIDRLQGEIEELFSDLWQVPRFAGIRHGFRPQVDCYRTSDPAELTVVVELPGIDPDAVQIAATPRTLIVSGERKREKAPGRVYQQMEIDDGAFQRQIPLDEDVDTSRATASYTRGLLTIVLPIAEHPPGPVKVSIDVTVQT
ncbi:MAG: Hsp20/alpha crystallin family protein [Gaiellaceae bacterium]